MTSRERLLASYRGQPVDRVPIRVWGADPWLELWHHSYKPIQEAALKHSDICIGWDAPMNHFLSGLPEEHIHTLDRPSDHDGFIERVVTYETPAGPLTQVLTRSPENKPGYVRKYLIENERDALAWLSMPYVPVRPDVSRFFEKERELGERGLMIAQFNSPVSLIYGLVGSELMAVWSVDNRDLLRALVSAMQKRVYDYVEHLLEQGVGPVLGCFGPEVCIPPLMSPRDFREFVVGVDEPIARLIRESGRLFWVHCHGDMGPCLDGFLEMGVNCLNPMEPPPLGITMSEARRRVGNRMCLEGNLEADDMFRAKPERIRELVRQAIEEARGGPLILCPTSAFMEWPTCNPEKVANYLAFIEAGLEYGQDPS